MTILARLLRLNFFLKYILSLLFLLQMFSFASALMHCGEHSEANTCAETVLLNDPANVKVNLNSKQNVQIR